MWKNIVDKGRPRMAIWRMRIAYRIPKVTNALLRYATFIAFSVIALSRVVVSFVRTFGLLHPDTDLQH
jgi:hypothetical protein